MPAGTDTEEHAASPQASDAGQSSRPKGRRYGFACVPCKQRKVKCSGEQPICAGCRRKSAECLWPANARSGTESQLLREANERIRHLEGSLRRQSHSDDSVLTRPRANSTGPHAQQNNGLTLQQSTRGSDRAKRQRIDNYQRPSDSAAAAAAAGLERGKGSELGGSPHSTRSSHTDGEGHQLAPSLWYQVGIGEDGGVVYNGPTSRFHAGTLPTQVDHDEEEDGSDPSGNEDQGGNQVASSRSNLAGTKPRNQDARSTDQTSNAVAAGHSSQGSHKQSCRMDISPGHLSILRSHYTLMDSVWTPLITAKPTMNGTGVDTKTGVTLLDIYWTWLHPLHHLVYRPAFVMDLALGGPHCSDFLLLCIFALAARHLPSEASGGAPDSTKGEEYANQARVLLLEEMVATNPSIPTIQGLLILGGRQCAIGASSQGWLYTGMAIRMMQDVGLHLDTTNLTGVVERWTPTELEVRKRLYNAAYVWDKTLCLALGRPPSLVGRPYPAHKLYDKYDDERLWRPVHAKEVVDTFAPCPSWVTSTLCVFSSLHEITTDMLLLFSRAQATKQVTEQVRAIDARFQRWYAELPDAMKISQPSGLSQSPPPHIVSLNLLYHTLHILLRRPFLGKGRQPPDSSVAGYTELCLSHSKKIHDIHTLYTKTFPHRLMTYQVSYCIYTAATVEALELKNASLFKEERSGAAARLTAAVRVLQNEASHTPGSGKSLDTIRRLLTEGDRLSAHSDPSRRKRRASNRNQPRNASSTRNSEDPYEDSPSAVAEINVSEASATSRVTQTAHRWPELGPPTTNTNGSSEYSIQPEDQVDMVSGPALTTPNSSGYPLGPDNSYGAGNAHAHPTVVHDPSGGFDNNAGVWGLDLGFYGNTDTGAGFHPDAFSFMFGANEDLPSMPAPSQQTAPPTAYLYSPNSLWSSRNSWPAQRPS